MKLSIIIVSYNSTNVLMQCLNSIDKYNEFNKELEVVVVDNYNETDMSYNGFPDYSYTLKYIRNSHNGGFGSGNNLGVKNASSEIIFFLNPDTIIVEPVFNDIYNTINSNKNIIFGFSLLDDKHKKNRSFSFMLDNYFVFQLLTFLIKSPQSRLIKMNFVNQRIWAWGAAFAMSKEKFEAAGTFDENIFLCHEEVDLMKRTENRLVYMSNHNIIHLEGHGVPASVNRFFESFKSREYYFQKYKVSRLNRMLWYFQSDVMYFVNSLFKNNINRQNNRLAYRRFKEYLKSC